MIQLYLSETLESRPLRLKNEELIWARAEAESSNRAKSEFLANMSHELRTPLTAILGFSDMLYEGGDTALTSARRAQTFDAIKNAGAHLLSIINDILDLSKIDAKIFLPSMSTTETIETCRNAHYC